MNAQGFRSPTWNGHAILFPLIGERWLAFGCSSQCDRNTLFHELALGLQNDPGRAYWRKNGEGRAIGTTDVSESSAGIDGAFICCNGTHRATDVGVPLGSV